MQPEEKREVNRRLQKNPDAEVVETRSVQKQTDIGAGNSSKKPVKLNLTGGKNSGNKSHANASGNGRGNNGGNRANRQQRQAGAEESKTA